MRKLPNIVLIVCDTLGAKHMSLYGYHRKTTPMLERLVEEEGFIVYKNCFATAPWTIPSHASLFTGLYPINHGTFGADVEDYFLDKNLFTLPEVLKSSGYKTIGISNNYLIGHYFGFSKGFDEFIEMDRPFLFKDELIVPERKKFDKLKFVVEKLLSKGYTKKAAAKLINALYRRAFGTVNINSYPYTVKTLKLFSKRVKTLQNSVSPFFLFVNLMETHDLYKPPLDFQGRFVKCEKAFINKQPTWMNYYTTGFSEATIDKLTGLYDEEVLTLDYILGCMYAELKKSAILDNTLFIITSDHGEALGEKKHFGHMFSMYNETLHIPLIVRFPEGWVNDKGENCDLVQLHDIYATILENIDCCMPAPSDSVSLLSSTKREYAVSFAKKTEIHSKL
ncbi:MAG: sulfatase, partial [Thermodesulfovibrionales bacterium]